ncbi:hypothetical protein GOP47_0013889 [Adiantum capillus-veneris]|uniref:Uncharacterized protein n=1 Tax=Adiantum capillus-veneris TaxID=13818 RepID=A0A9D4UPD4_ADICA|nr:hypothetical protein GOP47_0013889 [Adiantum capillus-veneris]
MEFHSPTHPLPASTARDENGLWHPSSSSYSSSPRREQMERTHMDRLRCKQDLQKLYEDMPENLYDLSLKDIVDPCYSISGNLKAIVAEDELKSDVQGCAGCKIRSWKNSSIHKLSFSFSFPGLRGKSRRAERPNLYAWKPSLSHTEEKASSASNDPHKANRSSSKYLKSSPEVSASSMSKIHPSNQCSSCSSFTIFFKSRCLVCGRLYCSICAKEYMDNLPAGFQCKIPCKNGPLRKRFSQKMASRSDSGPVRSWGKSSCSAYVEDHFQTPNLSTILFAREMLSIRIWF